MVRSPSLFIEREVTSIKEVCNIISVSQMEFYSLIIQVLKKRLEFNFSSIQRNLSRVSQKYIFKAGVKSLSGHIRNILLYFRIITYKIYNVPRKNVNCCNKKHHHFDNNFITCLYNLYFLKSFITEKYLSETKWRIRAYSNSVNFRS